MGFMGLISAENLAAAYDTQKKILYLYAQGQVQDFTTGIHFHQDRDFVGGYKFNLYGWTGPLKVPPTNRDYNCTQQFELELFAGTQEVIIVDANHQGGTPVVIRYFGLGDPFPIPTGDAVNETEVQAKAAESNLDRQISTNVGSTFQIRQSSSVNTGGAVTIDFDPAFLVMETASVVSDGGAQIEWTFKAIQAGQTHVKVLVEGGIATFVATIGYDVAISG